MSDLSVALRGWHMGIKTDVKYDSGSDHEVTSPHWNVLCRVVITGVTKIKANIGVFYIKRGKKSCEKYAIQLSPKKKRYNEKETFQVQNGSLSGHQWGITLMVQDIQNV